jgi:hypothetical protein
MQSDPITSLLIVFHDPKILIILVAKPTFSSADCVLLSASLYASCGRDQAVFEMYGPLPILAGLSTGKTFAPRWVHALLNLRT